jgi:hypothetical protein
VGVIFPPCRGKESEIKFYHAISLTRKKRRRNRRSKGSVNNENVERRIQNRSVKAMYIQLALSEKSHKKKA